MCRDDIIRSISLALQKDERVAALFLSGSLGRGTADRFSDIDLLAIAPRETHEAIMTDYQSSLAQATSIVFWRQRLAESSLVNTITEDWQRIDLLLTTPERVQAYSRSAVMPLFDRQNLFDTLPTTSPTPLPNRTRVEFVINEFIRVLGLLAVVVGREEYEVGVAGAGLLRAHLSDLLVEAAESAEKGGTLHLARIVSPDQRRILHGLPSPHPTRDSVIEAHLATARAFLPYAKKVAAQLGLPWPTNFETATWRYLERELGIICPL